jgi:hypothetical protein
MTRVSNSSITLSPAHRGSHTCLRICCRLIDNDTNSRPVSRRRPGHADEEVVPEL